MSGLSRSSIPDRAGSRKRLLCDAYAYTAIRSRLASTTPCALQPWVKVIGKARWLPRAGPSVLSAPIPKSHTLRWPVSASKVRKIPHRRRAGSFSRTERFGTQLVELQGKGETPSVEDALCLSSGFFPSASRPSRLARKMAVSFSSLFSFSSSRFSIHGGGHNAQICGGGNHPQNPDESTDK